ncbi:cache domain-containing protein [Salidesulfovibrio onnuriiensis]|uniref:cache domain-containing protein n=1 Tax=Salidesulfovibrio onnuriiensis TaxID=2583823 RepID=UPI0016505D13|nr:cache domain-containing protein [Salidesulfovibrio onnuriiensis]
MKRLPLWAKLFIGTSLGTLLVVAASSLLLFWVIHFSVEQDIRKHLTRSTASIRDLVRTTVNTAIHNHLRAVAEKNRDIVAHFHELARQGRMSEEEAKARAAEVLLSQPIGKTGYLFCVDSKVIMRVHPKASMHGADVNQFPLSKIQRELKNGYVEYEWANPGESAPRPKSLYMAYFEPWDWIISASSYREEFLELIRLDDFRESVLAHTIGDTGYSFIMADNGTLIIHPRYEGVNVLTSTDPMGNAFPGGLLKGDSGTIAYDWINPGETKYRKKIAVYDSIPELGWIVASTEYLDEVERPLHLLTYVVTATTVGMVLLLFLMSWRVARVATRPLPSLMQAFEEGAGGKLSLRMDEELGGEFGKLAAYYNHFMDNLEASRDRLAESEEKYRTIFEQAVEGMFQVLPEGIFVSINPAMARIFGYSGPEEMLAEVGNITKSLYVEPTDREKLYRELLDKGKVLGVPIRLRRRDGSIFWGEVSERMVLDHNGRFVLVEGILKDVTAQHDFMDNLARTKAEAEAASQLKSDFLIMISHEMRTPLTSILGFARMIKRQLQSKVVPAIDPADEDTFRTIEKAAGNLAIMETESSRLAKLIDDMLDFAGLEAGEIILCVKPANPGALAEQAVEAVSGSAAAKGLSLELDTPAQLPDVVADRDRIFQVLTHLLGNAVKFTSEGGVTLSAVPREEEMEFIIRDTGAGIPPESRERIFDHFTQLGDPLTDKPRGAGLGLALCRSIIALHRGRIWVESEPGQGSAFHFTLPLSKGGD